MNVQSEDIRLDPELYDSCRQDISRLCQNVAFGNAQVSMHTYAHSNTHSDFLKSFTHVDKPTVFKGCSHWL